MVPRGKGSSVTITCTESKLIAMNHFTRALHALLITGRTLLTACENHIFLCIVKPIAQPCAIRPASGIFIVLCWTATLVFLIFSASSVKRTVEVDRRWRWGWPIFAVLVGVSSLSHHSPTAGIFEYGCSAARPLDRYLRRHSWSGRHALRAVGSHHARA